MNSRKISLALALLASVMYANQVAANSFDYSSLGGAAINFNGSSKFSFSPTSSPNFKITDGALMGFEGDVSGTFTIGAVTTVGIFSTAPVTGTGSLVIDNGATDLTATLSWVSLTQIGTGSTLNDLGTVNLTNIKYLGSNPTLEGLAAADTPALDTASDTLSFTFVPAKSLAYLKSHAASTSFSGSIDYTVPVPDAGTTALLIGMGLAAIAIGVVARSRKAQATI